ncbi:hypothetical protein CH063_13737, partial [Colletotrichum higginsianum]
SIEAESQPGHRLSIFLTVTLSPAPFIIVGLAPRSTIRLATRGHQTPVLRSRHTSVRSTSLMGKQHKHSLWTCITF